MIVFFEMIAVWCGASLLLGLVIGAVIARADRER